MNYYVGWALLMFPFAVLCFWVGWNLEKISEWLYEHRSRNATAGDCVSPDDAASLGEEEVMECGEEHDGWLCTLEHGHRGVHVAEDSGGLICETWSNCCDCKNKVGVPMKRYNVIMSIGVDVEMEVEAENEETAQALALGNAVRRSFSEVLCEADFYATSTPEVVDSWEITG